MTTSYFLEQLIEQFLSTARERAASDRNGPFRHFSVASREDAQRAFSDTPNALRVLPSRLVPERYKSESCILRVGNLRLEYVDAETPFSFEARYKSDILTLRYTISGELSYFVGSSPLFTSRAGDFTIRFSKSQLLRAETSANYRGFFLAFPTPAERRFSIDAGKDTFLRIKPYLHDDFLLAGPPDSWRSRLAYVLDYALRRAASGTDSFAADNTLHELLYLLCLQELAYQARSIDANKRRVLIPLKLKVAENFVTAQASRAPSVAEVAAQAGLSMRSLHSLFVRFRDISPSDYIREQRLLGVRAALRCASPDASISEIAAAWTYQNLGNFAAAYKKRFGELPSQTLERRA